MYGATVPQNGRLRFLSARLLALGFALGFALAAVALGFALDFALGFALGFDAVGQLTGGVAHDFNNLLAVTISNLELLRAHVAEESVARKFLERAMQAAERGTILTERLLAFSRKQRLQPKPHHINDQVSGMLAMLQSSVGETVQISLKLAEGQWPVLVDAGQLGAMDGELLIDLAQGVIDQLSS